MSTHIIKNEISINAPAAQVFDALTNENILDKWFPSSAKSNAVTGGDYAFDYKFSDPEKAKTGNHVREGKFTELVPGKKVSYTWLNDTHVHFNLKEENGATLLSLSHEGWDAEKDAQSIEAHDQGWGFFLQNLKSFLETGKDMRPEMLGLITTATV